MQGSAHRTELWLDLASQKIPYGAQTLDTWQKTPDASPGFLPAEDTELSFSPKMAELRTQEGFSNWITAYGSKDLSIFSLHLRVP